MSREQSLQALSGAASLAQDALGAGQSVAQLQTPVVTAVRVAVHRDRALVKDRVLEEVAADPAECVYSWSVNDKDRGRVTIEGPSIKLAMVLVREYGNCTVYPSVASETDTHWNILGTFVDFETGFSFQREYRQRKPTQGRGRMDLDRTADINYQIGQSKAIRNVIVNALPASLLKAALTRAKEGEKAELNKDTANLPTQRAKVVDAFRKYGVDQPQLETRIGKKLSSWQADEIVSFRNILFAIRDKDTTVDVEFGAGGVPDDAPLDVDDIVGG